MREKVLFYPPFIRLIKPQEGGYPFKKKRKYDMVEQNKKDKRRSKKRSNERMRLTSEKLFYRSEELNVFLF